MKEIHHLIRYSIWDYYDDLNFYFNIISIEEISPGILPFLEGLNTGSMERRLR